MTRTTLMTLLAAALAIALTGYVAGRKHAQRPIVEYVHELHPEPIPTAQGGSTPAASATPPEPTWEPVSPALWDTLQGDWIGAEKGDAFKDGQLVVGGARVKLEHKRPGSRTPWNVHWVVPRKGDDSTTAGGGCGFYETGTAFCKEYGLPEGETRKTVIAIDRNDDRLRVAISGVLSAIELTREPVK
jgi:hypothetical protein